MAFPRDHVFVFDDYSFVVGFFEGPDVRLNGLMFRSRSCGEGDLELTGQAYLSVAQLRELLLGMEQELGIGDLSQNEKDVLYSVQVVFSPSAGVAKSDDIRNHMLLQSMTQPTFHRSLKSLIKKGFVGHAPNTKAGSYVLLSGNTKAA